MGKDAESDFAIPFVDENDYSEISAKAVSCTELTVSREILNTLNIFSGSFIIFSLKRAISGWMFIFFSLYSDYSYPVTLSIVGETS